MTEDTTAYSQDGDAFPFRIFGMAMSGFGIVLLGGIVFCSLNRDMSDAYYAEKLASQTVVIERDGGSAAHPASGQAHTDVAVAETFGPPAPVPHHTAPETAHTDHHAIPEEGHHASSPAPDHGHESSHGNDAAPPPGALSRAPAEGLYEDSAQGRLPVVNASTGQRPFDEYRRPFTKPKTGKFPIAIVVFDIGISEKMSGLFIEGMPSDVSLVLNPYAANPDLWMTEARSDGHEVWLELPTETSSYPLDDPGPQSLLISSADSQNRNRLLWALSRTSGYVGIVTGPDSVFMRATNNARPIIGEIFTRGLGFVDSSLESAELPLNIASGMKAPYEDADVWIDIPPTVEHASASFRQLEVLAQAEGSAIGFLHPSPMTLQMLQNWVSGLDAKGYTLVPLSAVSAGDL